MDSPRTLEACAEHNLPVTDKNETRTKQVQRAQWLRAAILGANDGLLSTAALMLGVGAAKEDQHSMILSGLAGAFAGACSMAVGEFVSVSTQRDIEEATIGYLSSETELRKQDNGSDIKLPIATNGDGATIVETKPTETKLVVSSVGIAGDTKAAMTKGEKEEDNEKEGLPNPYKAAAASASAFLCGSVIPLLPAMLIVQNTSRIVVIVVATSIALALFGGIGAYLGGSPVRISAVRVLLGGWMSMAITYGLLKPLDGDRIGHGTE